MTVAGTGRAENNGDNGWASSINIGLPFGVEFGPDGALYITEVKHHRIRRLDLSTSEITTVAGCGRAGYSGDGELALEAELNEPYEVRFDSAGNMYFVEMRNHVVRRVDARTRRISTVAGTGKPGFSGDGRPAEQALLKQPHSIALDGDRSIYVADIGNHRIRRIDLASGLIESVAGNSERALPRDGQRARGNAMVGPRAIFIRGGTMWIALREGHSIWRMKLSDGVLRHVAGTGEAGMAGDGGPAAKARFNGPKGIAVAPDGTIYVADSENNAIRRIDPRSGVVTSVPGVRLAQPHGVCVDRHGSVLVGDTMNHRVVRVPSVSE